MKQTKNKLLSLLGILALGFALFSCETQVEPPAPTTYTVTYTSEHGTVPEAITVEENTVLSEEQLPTCSYGGLVFKGWFDGDTKAVPGEYTVTDNVTLTARWASTATVSYHSKNGTVPESFDAELHQTLTAENLTPITCSPYVFLGWFYGKDANNNGTGEQINAGLAITNNTDLYAKWKTATVSFTTQYGTNPASIKKYTGEKITETEIPSLNARTGYTSDGWFNSSTKLTTNYTVNGDVAFTEKWTANTYSITFKANGGTGDDYTQTVTYATTAKLNPNTFTREGYTFNGWNRAANGSGTAYPDKADFAVNEANGVTLYAQWTPNEYTITYKANGGTGSDFTQNVTFGTTVKLAAANTFTHTGTGLCFAQWNTDADGEGANYSAETDFTVTEANDITLYARWENIVTRIKNMTESGTIVATGTCNTSTVRSINSALKDLYESHKDVLVTLDLSGVEGLSALEDSAFNNGYEYKCKNLEGIILPSSVTSIGDFAFFECIGLTSITIPSSVTSIGDYAFYRCSGLTSITIPSSVTKIGASAFKGCSGLTSITIPSSVTSIGGSAFEECSGLTSITIPSSVTSIEYLAFYRCRGLTDVTFADTESSWDFYTYGTKKGTRKMSATDTVGNATLLKSTYVNCEWRKQQ